MIPFRKYIIILFNVPIFPKIEKKHLSEKGTDEFLKSRRQERRRILMTF